MLLRRRCWCGRGLSLLTYLLTYEHYTDFVRPRPVLRFKSTVGKQTDLECFVVARVTRGL